MNTANLQLRGLLLGQAELFRLLVRKGLIARAEVDQALGLAEASLTNDSSVNDELSPAEHDVIRFPLRLLRLANAHALDEPLPGFASLAREIGLSKSDSADRT